MKAFEKWDREEYPLPPCYERGPVGREARRQRKHAFRAALEWVKKYHVDLEMGDWTIIEKELEDE